MNEKKGEQAAGSLFESQSMTCSVQEFARISGIPRDAAYAMVSSIAPPPGFFVGRSYRVIVARIGEYLDFLSESELRNRSIDAKIAK